MHKVLNIFLALVFFASTETSADEKQPKRTDFNVLLIEPSMPKNNLYWRKFGEQFDNFLGVYAFSNKENGLGGSYQCTELIHRYISEVFGLPTKVGIGLGHGKDLAKNLEVFFSKKVGTYKKSGEKIVFKYFANGKATLAPTVGSIISLSYGVYGHVAVARYIKYLSSDKMEIYLFEQHGELSFKINQLKPIRSITVTKDKYDKWQSAKVVGWLVPIKVATK